MPVGLLVQIECYNENMKKEQKIWKSSGRKYIKSVPKSIEQMDRECALRHEANIQFNIKKHKNKLEVN